MVPTRIYVKSVLKLFEAVTVKGLAHITGGGIHRERAADVARGHASG
jgi:phosphoribosylaminoimidazole (AIR) synthetase